MAHLTQEDYRRAALLDAQIEGLTIQSLDIANRLSHSCEEFFYAVQGAVILNDIVKDK